MDAALDTNTVLDACHAGERIPESSGVIIDQHENALTASAPNSWIPAYAGMTTLCG